MGGGPEKGEPKRLASAASGCRVANEPIYLADYFQKKTVFKFFLENVLDLIKLLHQIQLM